MKLQILWKYATRGMIKPWSRRSKVKVTLSDYWCSVWHGVR